MSNDIESEKKGFAGLSSLSTDVRVTDMPQKQSEKSAFLEKSLDEEKPGIICGYQRSKKNTFLAYSTIGMALLIFSIISLNMSVNVNFANISLSDLHFIQDGILLLIVCIIAAIESRTGAIIDKLTLPGILIGLITTAMFDRGQLVNHIIALFGAGIVLLLIGYGYTLYTGKGGMGGGIIKLLSMVGAFVGVVDVCLIFALSFAVAIIAETSYLVFNNSKGRVACEYGLYICFATVVNTAYPLINLIL